jgi:hypothetical protein
VPSAAQIAFNSTQGPRVPPGTYTVRMTKGKDVYETKIDVALDRRATYSVADHRAQYDAAMRVSGLFGKMTDLVFRINAVRAQADASAAKLPAGDATRKELAALSDKADTIRKKIVATKEGGAITGEERLREHMDTLYGAITSWDGKPADYQLARIDTLESELGEVGASFDKLESNELAQANARLRAAKLDEIVVPAGAPQEQGSSAGHGSPEVRSPWERD